jgi:phage terminase small subunit
MVRYAAEFGMTPSARTRIETSDIDEDDPLAEFLN